MHPNNIVGDEKHPNQVVGYWQLQSPTHHMVAVWSMLWPGFCTVYSKIEGENRVGRIFPFWSYAADIHIYTSLHSLGDVVNITPAVLALPGDVPLPQIYAGSIWEIGQCLDTASGWPPGDRRDAHACSASHCAVEALGCLSTVLKLPPSNRVYLRERNVLCACSNLSYLRLPARHIWLLQESVVMHTSLYQTSKELQRIVKFVLTAARKRDRS